jgi:hypothetical protein
VIRSIRVGDNDVLFLSKDQLAEATYDIENDVPVAQTFEKGDEIGVFACW